ncbi:MAG: hypothetical protein JWO31_1627, partial [Phycisphaerales bacterium]|nr:hypothetical protein [Phycisphaerales bacterium]
VGDEMPTDAAASPAALAHPGYEGRAVFLSAADAVIAGPKVKVEPRNPGEAAAAAAGKRKKSDGVDPAHRLPDFVVRGWTTPDDSAEWSFDCPKAGAYVVTFDCLAAPSWSQGKRSEAARLAVSAGAEAVPADVSDLGGGHRVGFQLVDVARLTLPAGPVTLRVAPRGEKQSGLPAIRSVRLYPADAAEPPR